MTYEITESDWKVYKLLHPLAFERFHDRSVSEIQQICCDTSRDSYDRFQEICKTVKERNKEIGGIFARFSRSSAILQLMMMRAHDLVTDEEMKSFSPDIRGIIETSLKIRDS